MVCVVPVLLVWLAVAAGAQELTTATTRYTYNADGALTQVVEQVDDNTPTTTYLTWDNFIPDAADPTTGTVLPGNGNLVAVGPEPGVDGASRSFAFDGEDRLTRYTDATGSVRYGFHPTWLLASSTLDGGDTRYFYYDNAETPQMTNIEDGDSGLMCTEMGDVRSLSDGGLQVLLSPRKDVAGVYDPAQGTFSAYHYDAFGDEGTSSLAPATYDLYDNPHRYAGEYKDPTWGGYYLRSRWYDPQLHTFLSRDSVANLNRYNYADGNPVARIDPDGKKSRHWGNKPWRWAAASKWVNEQSKSGHVWSRIFLAPVLGPLGLIAAPGSFFYQQVHSAGGFKGWVTLGALALEIGADAYTPELGFQSFAFRLLTDTTVGEITSSANAISHGGSKFSWRSLAQGMEYTAGGMFYARAVATRGYRPFNRTLDQIERMRRGLTTDDEVLVFKAKTDLNPKFRVRVAGPIGDLLDLSWYHEVLIGVTSDKVFFNEFGSTGGKFYSIPISERGLSSARGFTPELNERWGEGVKRQAFQYVGKADRVEFVAANRSNPLRVRSLGGLIGGGSNANPYDLLTRNCQRHVTAVVNQLQWIQ
jgi:RHS repeat-associated protein